MHCYVGILHHKSIADRPMRMRSTIDNPYIALMADIQAAVLTYHR